MGPGLVFGGFITGVALQLQQPGLWPGSLYPALAVLAALAGVVMGAWWLTAGRSSPLTLSIRGFRGVGVVALALAALLGFGLTGWRATVFQSAALDPALEGRDIAVTGVVLAMPQPAEDGLRFRLGIESARLNGQTVTLPRHILLGWYSGFGMRDGRASPAESADPSDLALELQRQPQDLRAGERWQMTVRLKAPHGNSNPHGFDYELWLWEQGIQATGYVRAGPHDTAPRRLSGSWDHPVESARQSVREAIFQRIGNRQLAGVVAALVVGDQNAIERADWDVFRATGVAHLMSISGLHVMYRFVDSLWT
ncbi:ComEC/Rec2 family competence protein [Polaromonas sp. P1(28)-8]|nr:ComEC/Rec2 family competence protein [Polaromonas sp. P1(28)-8]